MKFNMQKKWAQIYTNKFNIIKIYAKEIYTKFDILIKLKFRQISRQKMGKPC